MNIFYLHKEPQQCAEMHCDKHVVKMIVEYAQLLSTAHRVLDGHETIGKSQSGRKRKVWKLSDERDVSLYKATHINHPSAIWVRHSMWNYAWLSDLLLWVCTEYTHRYGKVHKVEASGLLKMLLINLPKNIKDVPFTEPTPAMPDEYKVDGSSVQSYHNYYNGAKQKLFSWKSRNIPEFVKSLG